MNRSTYLIVFFVILAFGMTIFAGCLPKEVGNIKLGKYGQTITVDKSDLSDKIKTQWGTFKFKEKQVAKIKKLKNVSKMKSSKSIEKNTFTCSKTIKGKSIKMAVTYLGGGKYQLVMGALDL